MGRSGQLPLLVSVPDGASRKVCAASAEASSWVKSLCGPRGRADGGCAGTGTCSRLTRNCIRYRQRLAPAGGRAIPDLDGQALAKTAEEGADGQCRAREREWGVVGAA